MMRLKDDLLALMLGAIDGRLGQLSAGWRDDAALTVVMAAEGYPGKPLRGSEIRGVDAAEAAGVKVFHAGTGLQNGLLIANGGRVLNITANGATVADAQKAAYCGVDAIDWPQGFCRRDIGWRAVAREREPKS
jgi:phosphoribosylamine--glycine ligase